MPLLDHFHPPLSVLRHWESFHARWSTGIAESLNRGLLPDRYFAEVQVHAGSRIEVDIGTFEHESDGFGGPNNGGREATGGGVAVAEASSVALSAPDGEFDAIIPPSVEVRIFSTEAGPTLVAAIELVSPGNKDREGTRDAFVQKCGAYLRSGVGVVIIDIVTERRANLNARLLTLLSAPASLRPPSSSLAASTYRPLRRMPAGPFDAPHEDRVQVWMSVLSVGSDLPVVPLPLDKGQLLALDLPTTYAEACGALRLPT